MSETPAPSGQSLSEIRGLLAAHGLAPQHRFGQNFLIDLNLLRKVVATAAPGPGDRVLEVGPGTGSLTELLLATGAEVVAVEIDRGLQRLLAERLGTAPGFTLIPGDVLSGKHQVAPAVLDALAAPRAPAQPGAACDGRLLLVANLPYQIATPLLIECLLEPRGLRLSRLVCTIQKEVGDRLAAAAQTPAYGPISVIVQTLAQVERIVTLPAEAFWPRPQVESVLLRIDPRPAPDELSSGAAREFAAFVQSGFGQRRKVLRRLGRVWGLAAAEAAEVFETAAIDPGRRPEELTPAAWVRLFAVWRTAAGRRPP
jgi:16S rRNA (adenine1518-N6/adenine1519-N6)-dimethyltransferase